MTIVTGLIGANTKEIFRPQLDGINAVGTYYDRYAPFALATRGLTDEPAHGGAIFARVSASIPNVDGTTPIGVTAGVTAAAAAGNNWYNKSGKTPIAGDYMWLVSGVPSA